MKKRLPVGLIIEGNSTNSAVLHLPGLADEIGPIKSTAPRVAKRLSNLLKAGYAVTGYDQLAEARLILIRAPDSILPRIIAELSAAELDFNSLSVAILESWIHSASLDTLREKGVCVATVMPLPSEQRSWFITEGDGRALRLVRLLIERAEGKTLELREGRKELYFAAELLAAVLPIPLFTAAQRALRGGGLSGRQLQLLLEEMAHKMFSDFARAPRLKWGGPLADSPAPVAQLYFDLLQKQDPALSELLNDALKLARRTMQTLRQG